MKKTIEISAGRGPKECNYAVEQVFKRLQAEASERGISVQMLSQLMQDGLPSSIRCELHGQDVAAFCQQWVGSILWICASPFRPNHARKNWFVAVHALESSPERLKFSEKDVEFQTMRSGGAGGQHVNKVSSAVRAIHKPSGLMVQVMDSRSQLQNKQLALQRLQEKIAVGFDEDKLGLKRKQWEQQVQLDRGNPKRTFEGLRFKEKGR